MKNDRFLLGILIGIGLLVALALGLYFLRQEQPAYVNDETPEGVVHNYVTAVQLGDYSALTPTWPIRATSQPLIPSARPFSTSWTRKMPRCR